MKNAATIVVLLLTGIAECQHAFLSASTSLASKSPAAGLKREEGLEPVKDGELLSTEDDVDWATGRLEEKIGIGQDVERLGSDGDSIGGDGDDNDEEEPRFRGMNRALKKTSSSPATGKPSTSLISPTTASSPPSSFEPTAKSIPSVPSSKNPSVPPSHATSTAQ